MCGNRIFEKTFQIGPISSAQMTVTGTASVCPGNQYTYQANVPGGHQAGYVYQWTIPAGWSVQSQWNNMITLYVPSNYQDYGTARFRVNNGCGFSGNLPGLEDLAGFFHSFLLLSSFLCRASL